MYHLPVISIARFFSFAFKALAWSGWYSPPGLDDNVNRASEVSATLKNAAVTCGVRPKITPQCTRRDGPCLFNIEEDPCEYVNQAKNESAVLASMLHWLEQYKETMVSPRNQPVDPRANPDNFGGVWSPWMDEQNAENHASLS